MQVFTSFCHNHPKFGSRTAMGLEKSPGLRVQFQPVHFAWLHPSAIVVFLAQDDGAYLGGSVKIKNDQVNVGHFPLRRSSELSWANQQTSLLAHFPAQGSVDGFSGVQLAARQLPSSGKMHALAGASKKEPPTSLLADYGAYGQCPRFGRVSGAFQKCCVFRRQRHHRETLQQPSQIAKAILRRILRQICE
jgi:hypothetical protein